MDTYKHFRKQFGLSQEDLAMFLGVNRISIIRMEKGRSDLNTVAWQKIADMQKCTEQEKPKLKTTCTEATMTYCRDLEADCLFRLTSLKRKLVRMQGRFDESCRLRSLLERVNPGTDKRTQAWVKLQAFKMERTAGKYNETQQAAQQALIMMCAAELQGIRKYMRQNKIRSVEKIS